MDKKDQTASIIERDLDWIETIVKGRIQCTVDSSSPEYQEPAVPVIEGTDTFYEEFINKYGLTSDERKVVLLALATEVRPEMFDAFLIFNSNGKVFSEFGGTGSSSYGGFLPTVRTAMLMLTGKSCSGNIRLMDVLGGQGKLYRKGILDNVRLSDDEPSVNRRLRLSSDMIKEILNGEGGV